jgi:DNA-binding NarL/FixJ family response regulator
MQQTRHVEQCTMTADQVRKKQILIVDDHPIVRRGLASLINLETDMEVCGYAEDGPSALDIIRSQNLDLMVMDIFLKNSNGIDILKSLQKSASGIPVLVVSMHDEELYAERVIRAGAMGYVMKREAEQTIVEAIRQILAGRVYLSERMHERLLLKLSGRQQPDALPENVLSDRELQIFEMLGRGRGIREIAEELFISIKTVDTHRARIKEKLNLKDSTDVLRHAIQWVQGDGASTS